MPSDLRRTRLVHTVFKDLIARGAPDAGIRPGAINTELRERGSPMGAWEVRTELTALEAAGEARCDPATGIWYLMDSGSQKSQKRSSA
ncbi:MAG: hypothetical protein HC809_09715 [Gammaproteobacteria bacterium]|nr:hypothetical protein [Gammaproteobacteria bacterium]